MILTDYLKPFRLHHTSLIAKNLCAVKISTLVYTLLQFTIWTVSCIFRHYYVHKKTSFDLLTSFSLCLSLSLSLSLSVSLCLSLSLSVSLSLSLLSRPIYHFAASSSSPSLSPLYFISDRTHKYSAEISGGDGCVPRSPRLVGEERAGGSLTWLTQREVLYNRLNALSCWIMTHIRPKQNPGTPQKISLTPKHYLKEWAIWNHKYNDYNPVLTS